MILVYSINSARSSRPRCGGFAPSLGLSAAMGSSSASYRQVKSRRKAAFRRLIFQKKIIYVKGVPAPTGGGQYRLIAFYPIQKGERLERVRYIKNIRYISSFDSLRYRDINITSASEKLLFPFILLLSVLG